MWEDDIVSQPSNSEYVCWTCEIFAPGWKRYTPAAVGFLRPLDGEDHALFLFERANVVFILHRSKTISGTTYKPTCCIRLPNEFASRIEWAALFDEPDTILLS